MVLTRTINKAFTSKTWPLSHASTSSGLFGHDALLGMPLNSTPESWKNLAESVVSRSQDLLDRIPRSQTSLSALETLDNVSDLICRYVDRSDVISMLHPDPIVAGAASEGGGRVRGYVSTLNSTRNDVYSALTSLEHSSLPLSSVTKRTLRLLCADFEAAGIARSPDEQRAVVEKEQSVATATSEFGANLGSVTLGAFVVPGTIATPSLEQTLGVRPAQRTPGALLVPLSMAPSLIVGSSSRPLRELAYKALYRDSGGARDALYALLQARSSLASSLGWSSFAESVVQGEGKTVAQDAAAVAEWVRGRVFDPLAIAMRQEESSGLARQFGITTLAPWDLEWASNRALHAATGGAMKAARKYLSVGSVLAGIAGVSRQVFGVSVEPELVTADEVWDPSVGRLGLFDVDSGCRVGTVWLDLHDGPRKAGFGPATFTVNGSTHSSPGSVVLSMKLRSVNMSPQEVGTLWHEWGHVLHGLLGSTEHQHVSGTRVEGDLVELPSQVLERWAWHPGSLVEWAVDSETSEHMPDNIARALGAVYNMTRLSSLSPNLTCGILDAQYHGPSPPGSGNSTSELWAELESSARSIPIAQYQGMHWPASWAHPLYYGGTYYGYEYAQVLADAVWDHIFEGDPWDRRRGAVFRRWMMNGGSVPGSEGLAFLFGGLERQFGLPGLNGETSD